jgi:hypothetical protein
MKPIALDAFLTRIAAFALLAVCTAITAAEPHARRSELRRPRASLGLMLNDDGDRSAASDDPDESVRLLREAVDSLDGTNVKTLLWCIGCGSDVLYYPTKVASCAGWQSPDARGSVPLSRARRMIEAGHEPLRVVGERAKKLGLRFFPTCRMNDAHFAGSDPNKSALTGEFWSQHHAQLSMAADTPSTETRGVHHLLSYAHAEVRAHRVAIALEVLERYADTIDGIELDFTRHPILYRHGQGREHFDEVTAIVKQVRERVDAMSETHARPFYLLVRVPPTFDNCHWVGLDIERWIDERLVDVVTLSHMYATVLEMPAADWASRCRAANVPLYVTIFPRSDYTNCFTVTDDVEAASKSLPGNAASLDFIRAAAANYRSMGVDGFEMFNVFVPLSPYSREVQRILGTKDVAGDGNRLYAITRSEMDLWALKHPTQLPRSLAAGKAESLAIFVGEDFAKSLSKTPTHGLLRLGVDGLKSHDVLKVCVNETVVHDGPVGSWFAEVSKDKDAAKWPRVPEGLVQFVLKDLSVLRQGSNAVNVECVPANTASSVELIDVQIGLVSDHRDQSKP